METDVGGDKVFVCVRNECLCNGCRTSGSEKVSFALHVLEEVA